MDRFALSFQKVRTVAFAVLLAAAVSPAWTAGDWIEQGDAFDRKFRSAEALAAYQKAASERPDDAELQRKIAKQYIEMVLDAPSRREQSRLAEQGYQTALRAKELEAQDPEVRLTVGIAAARLAFYSGSPRRKLELSRVARDEAMEAVRLNPRYGLGWHMLGRWHYELAGLNPVLRMLAETIYGRQPAASYDQAVQYLERAVQLESGNALFHAELGRAYLAAGRPDEARRELQKSLTLPQRSRDDAAGQDRARQALREL